MRRRQSRSASCPSIRARVWAVIAFRSIRSICRGRRGRLRGDPDGASNRRLRSDSPLGAAHRRHAKRDRRATWTRIHTWRAPRGRASRRGPGRGVTVMHLAFWSAAAFIAYVYAGYPAALWLWTLLRSSQGRKPTSGSIANAGWRPGISIIIAARNEAPHLRGRIENLLQLAYPPSRRQIIVVSDGSSDDTKAVLAPYRDAIDLVSVPVGGKARALNAGVSRARGELLVFTD